MPCTRTFYFKLPIRIYSPPTVVAARRTGSVDGGPSAGRPSRRPRCDLARERRRARWSGTGNWKQAGRTKVTGRARVTAVRRRQGPEAAAPPAAPGRRTAGPCRQGSEARWAQASRPEKRPWHRPAGLREERQVDGCRLRRPLTRPRLNRGSLTATLCLLPSAGDRSPPPAIVRLHPPSLPSTSGRSPASAIAPLHLRWEWNLRWISRPPPRPLRSGAAGAWAAIRVSKQV